MRFDPASLTYDDRGLIPCIAQDHASGEVLMLAWMNAEAVAKTLATGRVTYWSRSRQAFWIKGETSGHAQRLVELPPLPVFMVPPLPVGASPGASVGGASTATTASTVTTVRAPVAGRTGGRASGPPFAPAVVPVVVPAVIPAVAPAFTPVAGDPMYEYGPSAEAFGSLFGSYSSDDFF